jgi:ABC-type multidrug transport system fused ATPase/permease subunit
LCLYDFKSLTHEEANTKIEEACRQANCWYFIHDLPLKVETKVGGAGTMFSGI